MSDLRVIDTHTHFYDPKRPRGIPSPNKNDEFLYRTVLPDEYKTVTKPLGVHGTVVVEASKRFEDNLWVLELAKTEPFIIGFVGNLQLNSDDFDVRLDKLRVDPLFRGIRLGGIITKQLTKQEQARLEHLAYYDLALDILGGADVLSSVAEIAENIPNLRIIIDHLGSPSINGQSPDRIWTEAMQLLAQQAPRAPLHHIHILIGLHHTVPFCLLLTFLIISSTFLLANSQSKSTTLFFPFSISF